MKWPWEWSADNAALQQAIATLRQQNQQLITDQRDLKYAIDSRQRADIQLILDLKLEVDQKDDEIRRLQEKLKAQETPKGEFLTCPCGSHRTAVVHHIIGWKPNPLVPEGAVPVPLGGQVVCVDCRSPLNIDERVERAKVKEKHEKERERPPVQDSDLRFSGRRRP